MNYQLMSSVPGRKVFSGSLSGSSDPQLQPSPLQPSPLQQSPLQQSPLQQPQQQSPLQQPQLQSPLQQQLQPFELQQQQLQQFPLQQSQLQQQQQASLNSMTTNAPRFLSNLSTSGPERKKSRLETPPLAQQASSSTLPTQTTMSTPLVYIKPSFYERTLYFDIYETPDHFIKVSKNVACTKEKIEIQNWESENQLKPTTILGLVSPDDCWLKRVDAVMQNLDHPTIAKIVSRISHSQDCFGYKRKLIKFTPHLQDTCTQYYIEREENCMPMSKCDLTKLSSQTLVGIIDQIKRFVIYLITKSHVALVLNEGCFLLSSTGKIRYYRHEHIYESNKSEHIRWMETQRQLFCEYLEFLQRFASSNESFEPIEPMSCTERQRVFFGRNQISDDLFDDASLLATGLDSLVFLSRDEKYVIKVIQTVDKLQYEQRVNPYHDNHYFHARENFIQEVNNLKKVVNAGSPHYVVRPIAAYTTSKPFTEFDFLYDIPGYDAMKYQEMWNRATPCAGVIVTEYFGNQTLAAIWNNYQSHNEIIRDVIGYSYMFLQQIDNIIHTDLHLNNILVRPGPRKLLTTYYKGLRYYWISLPYDYLILDLGRCDTRTQNSDDDLKKMLLITQGAISPYMPKPYTDSFFSGLYNTKMITLKSFAYSAITPIQSPPGSPNQVIELSSDTSQDAKPHTKRSQPLEQAFDIRTLFTPLDEQLVQFFKHPRDLDIYPTKRRVSCRIVDMLPGRDLAKTIMRNLSTIGFAGSFYNGNTNQTADACGYVATEAVNIMYETRDVKDAWKFVSVDSAADIEVVQRINTYLQTPGKLSKEYNRFRNRNLYQAQALYNYEIFQVLRDMHGIPNSFCVAFNQFFYALTLTLPQAAKGEMFYYVVNNQNAGSLGIHWAAVTVCIEE